MRFEFKLTAKACAYLLSMVILYSIVFNYCHAAEKVDHQVLKN